LIQKNTYITILLFVTFICKSQINKQKFLSDFYKSDFKAKVRLVANSNFNEIKNIYPIIKDSLNAIKQKIYNHTKSKEAKFLFDKIEVNVEMSNGNYAKAIYILKNCIQSHAITSDDSLTCFILLKESFLKIQDYVKAFETNRLIEKIAHRKSQHFKMDLGAPKSTLFYNIGLTKEAIKQRREEFTKNYNPADTTSIINFYNDMGVFYNNAKNRDSAEFYFLKAKQLLTSIKIPAKKLVFYTFFKGLVDGNLGNCYFINGQVQTAIPFLKNDIYCSILSDNFESASNAYQLLARCYIKLNEPNSAKQYIDSATNLIKRYNFMSKSSLNISLIKAEYYNLIDDYKIANEHYLAYIKLKDSINIADKERQLLNEEVAFNVEQKEIEIAEKNSSLELNKLNTAKQKTFKAYLLVGIIMLLGVIVFLILNAINVKKRQEELAIKNNKINNQNLLIEQSLKEKELLIKEIHHRVKNNLQIIISMLSLQIGKISDEKTEAILREAKQRITSIALTHQMLYQKNNLSTILLGDYIEKLVKQIELSFQSSSIKLTLNIQCTEVMLSIDNAVPLGLLINEVLTNAYKHAFVNRDNGTIEVI
jgi:two-component sensor histidine kinase